MLTVVLRKKFLNIGTEIFNTSYDMLSDMADLASKIGTSESAEND